MTTDDVTISDIEDGPAERLPGDFLRVKGSGAPRVLRLDGSGKRDTYGRPSSLYVGNTFGLDRWKEQRLLAGIQLMLDRGEAIDGAADTVVRRALELAEAGLAAERGTGVHTFIESVHGLRDLERAELSVIGRLEHLGFSPEFIEGTRLAYARALDRYGLEPLATEAKCVIDEWRVAGSADTFMRCHDTLTFDDGGVIPAGEVVCEDHKTGQLRIASGRPSYWLHYAAQIAAYARSSHYVIDGEEEWREPWPWAVNQRSGLILHLDVLGCLDTDVMTVRPIRVDLPKGRQLAEHAVAGREIERTMRAFGFSQQPPVMVTIEVDGPSQLEQQLEASLEAAAERQEAAVAPVEVAEPSVAPQAVCEPPAAAQPPMAAIRSWLQLRIDTIGAHSAGARADLGRRWPAEVAPLTKSDGHTEAELAAIEQLCDRIETAHSVPFGPSRPGATDGTADGWLSHLLAAFPGSTINTKEHSTT